MEQVNVEVAAPFECALSPDGSFIDDYDFFVWYGGRAGAKSWSIARLLIQIAYRQKVRVLCAREFQASIRDSVHKLLSDQIEALGLDRYFITQNNTITSWCGSEFLFKGIQRNIKEIKSTEGIDLCWMEEAQGTSEESWEILIPTIRKIGSKIIISFNPDLIEDATYQRFIVNPPPRTLVVKVNCDDNPWLSAQSIRQLEHCKKVDPERYDNIWLGNPRKLNHALVYANKFRVEYFDAPLDAQFMFGADWGFSQDPCALIRCFIDDYCLFIDYEAYEIGVEIDQLPIFFDKVPLSRQWRINADNSRPETISYMSRHGFNVQPARKWPGSVEEGVQFIRQFVSIIIHPRCVNVISEIRHYVHKIDKNTGEPLTDIVDKNNHAMDAIRYALDCKIDRDVYDYYPIPLRHGLSAKRL